MNKLIMIIAASFTLTFTISAQSIVKSNGKCGLNDSAGNQVLTKEYDHIEPVSQFRKFTGFYILRQGNQFGLFHSGDGTNTGCVYDSVYQDYNIIYLKNGDKIGYVAQTAASYQFIEPQYKYVFPICESPHLGPETIFSYYDYNLSACKDSLWGIISFSDGHVVIPLKYRNEITRKDDDYVWVCEDGESGKEILINPNTGVEFHTTWWSRCYLSSDHEYILYYERYYDSKPGCTLSVCQYSTGNLVWSYTSHAEDAEAFFVTDNIVCVTEEYERTDKIRDDSRNVYSFYNITNSALLFTHESKSTSDMDLDSKDNKIMVFISETYNGQYRLVGEIFK